MGLLEGKVAVITGGGGGMGRSFALDLAREGAAIVVNDLGVARDGTGNPDKKPAESVVAEIKKNGGKACVSNDTVTTKKGAEAIAQTALQSFGRIDVLINAAGIISHQPLLEMEEAKWDRVLETHLKGALFCTQAMARVMLDGGKGGSIINISSLVGLQGNPGQVNYAAAKAGVAGLTLSSALELKSHGIRVNCIVPVAYTRLTRDEPMFLEEGLSKRFSSEHVAPVVVYLASELSGKVNGSLIGVQGTRVFSYALVNNDGVSPQETMTPQQIHDNISVILKI